MSTRIVVMLEFVALSARASAHHSFAAFYFEDQSVSIEGVVTEFHYVNPHAWVYISARDVEGVLRTVGAEWSNPARLAQAQIGKDTLGRPTGWTWAGRAGRR